MAMPILSVVKRIAKSAEVRISARPDKRFKKPKVSWFKEDIERLGEEIAEEFKDTVTENIEENRYGFENAESTIKRKGSDTPLIDTGELVGAIYRDGTTVSVEDSPRDDSPLTNLELAIVQEYGTKDKHIPARPVWRETFKDFREVAEGKISDFLETHKFKE